MLRVAFQETLAFPARSRCLFLRVIEDPPVERLGWGVVGEDTFGDLGEVLADVRVFGRVLVLLHPGPRTHRGRLLADEGCELAMSQSTMTAIATPRNIRGLRAGGGELLGKIYTAKVSPLLRPQKTTFFHQVHISKVAVGPRCTHAQW